VRSDDSSALGAAGVDALLPAPPRSSPPRWGMRGRTKGDLGRDVLEDEEKDDAEDRDGDDDGASLRWLLVVLVVLCGCWVLGAGGWW